MVRAVTSQRPSSPSIRSARARTRPGRRRRRRPRRCRRPARRRARDGPRPPGAARLGLAARRRPWRAERRRHTPWVRCAGPAGVRVVDPTRPRRWPGRAWPRRGGRPGGGWCGSAAGRSPRHRRCGSRAPGSAAVEGVCSLYASSALMICGGGAGNAADPERRTHVGGGRPGAARGTPSRRRHVGEPSGGGRSWVPGRMRSGSSPMTARLAAYHRGHSRAIAPTDAPGPRWAAAMPQSVSPRRTVTASRAAARGRGDGVSTLPGRVVGRARDGWDASPGWAARRSRGPGAAPLPSGGGHPLESALTTAVHLMTRRCPGARDRRDRQDRRGHRRAR